MPLFKIAQILVFVIFVSVYLMRKNLTGLSENLVHKIRALVIFTIQKWKNIQTMPIILFMNTMKKDNCQI